MTTDDREKAMRISQADMDTHTTAGRAARWTHALGPDREIPLVALFEGTFYVVLEGAEDYQPAPPLMASALTEFTQALSRADDAITVIDDSVRVTLPPGRHSS